MELTQLATMGFGWETSIKVQPGHKLDFARLNKNIEIPNSFYIIAAQFFYDIFIIIPKENQVRSEIMSHTNF